MNYYSRLTAAQANEVDRIVYATRARLYKDELREELAKLLLPLTKPDALDVPTHPNSR